MSKRNKTKSLKREINPEKAEMRRTEDKRKNTVHVFILLSPFIAMFGMTLYGMVH